MLPQKHSFATFVFCFSLISLVALWQSPAKANTSPNYGIYASTILAYEKEWGLMTFNKIKDMELYDVWGVPHIQVTDLNNDGIRELLLVRMDRESAESGQITSPKSVALQVFTLDKGKYIKHLGAFPLLRAGLSATVQVATVGQKKYIISGDASDATSWHKIFWELTPTGFVKAKTFTSAYTNQVHFAIDDKEANEATFTAEHKQWTQDVLSVVISNGTFKAIEDLDAQNTKERQKLANYPTVDGVGPAAIFNNGRFLILEDMPKNAQEKMLVQYFQAYTNSNFTKLKNMIVPIDDPLWSLDVEHMEKRIAQKHYIPGYIIEKINTVPADQAGHQTVLLLENAMPILKTLNLHEHVFVRAIVNEVKDFTHTTFAPQVCYGTYNFWGLFGKKDAQAPWKMYALFTDHILYPHMHANPFAVKFLGYKNDWQGMPDLAPFYTDKELATINHNDFGGEEMYVVRNKFGGETKAYEAVITDDGQLQAGRLLHTYKPGELMFFTCNVSDIRPNVILRYVAPYGAVYDYTPSISLKDGSVNYDPYGEAESTKKDRGNSIQVF